MLHENTKLQLWILAAYHTVGRIVGISQWQWMSPVWGCLFIDAVAFGALCCVCQLCLENLETEMSLITQLCDLLTSKFKYGFNNCSPQRPLCWPYVKSYPGIQQHHIVDKLQNDKWDLTQCTCSTKAFQWTYSCRVTFLPVAP